VLEAARKNKKHAFKRWERSGAENRETLRRIIRPVKKSVQWPKGKDT